MRLYFFSITEPIKNNSNENKNNPGINPRARSGHRYPMENGATQFYQGYCRRIQLLQASSEQSHQYVPCHKNPLLNSGFFMFTTRFFQPIYFFCKPQTNARIFLRHFPLTPYFIQTLKKNVTL